MSILYERVTKNVCNILINRPAKRNALNFELIKQLQDRIQQFEHDDQYSIAILSGAGGNFCAGYDLNEVIDKSTGMPNLHMITQMLWPLGTSLSSKKMLVASLDGHTAGFGFELALKCDFRIAENDARMGFLNRRFGIPIMNGGTVMLDQLIGRSRAMQLVATGRAQLAPDALSSGLISLVSDVGCAFGQSLNLARSLVKFRQDCLMSDLNHSRFKSKKLAQGVLDQLQNERRASLDYLSSCGSLDVAVAFLEGKLCRHGSTNLGNLEQPNPEVTL